MTEPTPSQIPNAPASEASNGENPSFVKLAMRNMVRKGRQSLFHFGLTAAGFLGFITLIAWLGRPQIPGG
ncbi:MAG: DUF3285 domain-containing protein [Cyanobacteriota bacterium]|nr:DUF3285 domain-containing protein [Cyanobacteriota bacterium]